METVNNKLGKVKDGALNNIVRSKRKDNFKDVLQFLNSKRDSDVWVTFLAETLKDLEIILITTVLSFTNSLSGTSLYFSLKTSFVYSNLSLKRFEKTKLVTKVVMRIISKSFEVSARKVTQRCKDPQGILKTLRRTMKNT